MRGVAVLMVLLCHVTNFWKEAGDSTATYWITGKSGVDLFFVISGVVMVLSTSGRAEGRAAAGKFLQRRALRLMPLYWLATAVYTLEFVIVERFPILKTVEQYPPHLNWKVLSTSLLLIPHMNGGDPLPLVGVGWTLSYECFFYVLFAVAVCFRWNPLRFLTPVMLFLVLAAQYFNPRHGIAALTGPFLLEFLAGVALASFVRNREMPKWAAVSLGVVSLVTLCYPLPEVGYYGRIIHGIPAFFLVAAVLLGERHLRGLWPQWILVIGDASYSLYLVHILVFCILFRIFQATHLAYPGHSHTPQQIVAIGLAMVGAIGASLLLYYKVEIPMNSALRDRFLPKGRLQVQSAG